MTRPITAVKKEIRILGLDTCNKTRIVGAVVRGGLYLDGVLSFPWGSTERVQLLASEIIRSQYFPELRSIMLHNHENRLDGPEIEEASHLPVIEVSVSRPTGKQSYHLFRGTQGSLWVRTKLPARVMEEILRVTWTTGRLPEPARISHLLSRTRMSNVAPLR